MAVATTASVYQIEEISQSILLLTLQSAAALVLAAPAPAPGPGPRPAAEASGDREEAPRSWRLDCGSPGVTAMCSASNNGAHCDPVSGELTIILAGTCGACKCVTEGECSRGCGR
ncbi:uncharacterized protein F4807DRAFT_459340 [Annulohypoxylon truncatum]|uniref:uncharacterized protein n=1 Tax=Annulohypoxylon truncatum TaxID=327061 RepID=UPI002007B430|nr:uncharacterized protein F4807DRAFT_459340 [Annulohypoxylon truncatum]KAI1211109.1 hypothetical protein F4807DRAFT_459340 [Annulohypoxylon truncatum]